MRNQFLGITGSLILCASADAVLPRTRQRTYRQQFLPPVSSTNAAGLGSRRSAPVRGIRFLNDAPAPRRQMLASVGTGTDVAMEAGGITLIKGDLRGIVRARHLSIATMRNIRQNLFFAFVYNAIGVPIAAGVLFPAFGLLLNPMIAAAAMSFSSVSRDIQRAPIAGNQALKKSLKSESQPKGSE